jgi:NAD-dependent dihydropyrimidine dehydrogenase PreA subunit
MWMTYLINEKCIDQLDGACVSVCPVDCIYEGLRKRYINPNECVDCGACLTQCPVDAIETVDDIAEPTWLDDNARFFAQPLPGRDGPVNDPGGATSVGTIGADTPLVAGWPKQPVADQAR